MITLGYFKPSVSCIGDRSDEVETECPCASLSGGRDAVENVAGIFAEGDLGPCVLVSSDNVFETEEFVESLS